MREAPVDISKDKQQDKHWNKVAPFDRRIRSEGDSSHLQSDGALRTRYGLITVDGLI